MSQKKILITEDEVIIADDLKYLLEKYGYEVPAIAVNGQQAIEFAKQYQPDLILMDIVLSKGIDGIETASELKKIMDVPIIFITAYTDDYVFKKAITADPYGYLIKPYNERELTIIIEMAFYRQEMMQKLNQTMTELKELNNMKDKFFSVIAHDLRSPMTAFFSGTQILMHLEDMAQVRSVARHIGQTAENLYKLVENLLEWSRIQMNAIEISMEKHDLSATIIRCIDFMKYNLEQKGITIDFQPVRYYVFADNYLIESIIRNLISNAIKFTPRLGKIKVELKKDNDFIVCQISDNGVGIPKENLNKLFRLDQTVKTQGTLGEKGTGLGLLLCKEFIQKNNGQIWVESEEGEGSTFSFKLPAAN